MIGMGAFRKRYLPPNPEADYDWTGLCPRGLHVAHDGACPGEAS